MRERERENTKINRKEILQRKIAGLKIRICDYFTLST
jgi:hypothetical protein